MYYCHQTWTTQFHWSWSLVLSHSGHRLSRMSKSTVKTSSTVSNLAVNFTWIVFESGSAGLNAASTSLSSVKPFNCLRQTAKSSLDSGLAITQACDRVKILWQLEHRWRGTRLGTHLARLVAALRQAWHRFLRLGWIGVAHWQQGISPNPLSETGKVAASIILGFCPLWFSFKSLLLLQKMFCLSLCSYARPSWKLSSWLWLGLWLCRLGPYNTIQIQSLVKTTVAESQL